MKKLLVLIPCFVIATVIGTLAHEGGHIAVASCLGYQTRLHYGSMNYYGKPHNVPQYDRQTDSLLKRLKSIVDQNRTAILDRDSFKDKQEYLKICTHINHVNKTAQNRFLIGLGGPFQTISTAILGLVLLLFSRHSIRSNGLKCRHHLYIFLSLFLLRQVFNSLHGILPKLLQFQKPAWGKNSDEVKIAQYLNWDIDFVMYTNLIVSSLICALVIFKWMPKEWRFPYIISGFLGGLFGYYLWFDVFGPMLLP